MSQVLPGTVSLLNETLPAREWHNAQTNRPESDPRPVSAIVARPGRTLADFIRNKHAARG